ncbi:hypothetical protein [Rhodococcus sp. T7]|uniref:hypothetical protein n=1 Tax=Rhodococcus sp. T7 TaxID=627444 RepID=UPI001357583D|nr:hypothetical protein [Rhodococcus sp. T7]KAF0957707.1 hypothetical protein MLGJGCBP_09539 [Rhodococcus sp. T7]KAF0964253.1 hypothetical protein MLGJGCBP_02604 [Rhodococcus sp. T7]
MSELETVDDLSDTPRSEIAAEALALLNAQVGLLVHASTDGSKQPTENDRQYKQNRRKFLRLMATLKMKDPIPYENLGVWNGLWKSMPTLATRRRHVNDLVATSRTALESIKSSVSLVVPETEAGVTWRDVDTRVAELGRALERAESTDDLQDVGRRSREILIDAAKILANPDLVPAGEDEPKAGDAKNWLKFFINRYAAGSSQQPMRTFIRSTWDLAQRVTHGNIDRTETYAAAQATVLIVRVLQDLEAREP